MCWWFVTGLLLSRKKTLLSNDEMPKCNGIHTWSSLFLQIMHRVEPNDLAYICLFEKIDTTRMCATVNMKL